jgi:hypothetical protein
VSSYFRVISRFQAENNTLVWMNCTQEKPMMGTFVFPRNLIFLLRNQPQLFASLDRLCSSPGTEFVEQPA